MRRFCRRLIAALALSACAEEEPVQGLSASSETGATEDGTTEAGGSVSLSGSATSSDASSSSDPTTLDSTCGEACSTTTGSPSSTSESSSTSDGGEPESTSEGPTGVCGDGIVEGAEECDEAGASATCDDDCTFAECGDEIVNEAAGEVCDEGGEAFGCDADCTLPECGDGITNESVDEACDGGGETYDCDLDCSPATCGDGTQNLTALETCDDGNNLPNDGCSATCVQEGEFGGFCRVVGGLQWCFDNDACGYACEDVCSALGLTLEPDDAVWFAGQDSLAECQAIADAFAMTEEPDFGDHALGCLEDEGLNDLVGGGLTGRLSCSSDPSCPAAHRTDMNNLGTNCNLVGARRSVCPCAGEFCGNGVVEGSEICDDGNALNNDGCTTSCIESGCGDGDLDEGEHCDGATGFASVGCSTDCLYDFSAINQLYCNGTCTWAGADDCDQADADIYCKLVTGDPDSVAIAFSVVIALDEPGFSCPSYGTNLGTLTEFVDVDVWYQESSIAANHGNGNVVADVTCG